MISSNNILKPSDGRPVAEPSQDIVLGCYFATKGPHGFDALLKDEKAQQKLRTFGSAAEIEMALALSQLTVHSAVRYFGRTPEGKRAWMTTTAGRVLFDGIVPSELPFQNRDMKKKALGELVFESYRKVGLAGTVLTVVGVTWERRVLELRQATAYLGRLR